MVADLPADLYAVHAGQHQVEEQQVGAELGHRGEAGLAGRGRPYLVAAAAQTEFDPLAYGGVVLDEEHAGHRRFSR